MVFTGFAPQALDFFAGLEADKDRPAPLLRQTAAKGKTDKGRKRRDGSGGTEAARACCRCKCAPI